MIVEKCWVVLCDFKKATQMCHSFFFHSPTNPLLSFFHQQSNGVWLWQCVMLAMCKRRGGGECCGMGRRQGVWVWEWRGMKGWGFGGWMGWMWVWWLGVKRFVIVNVSRINPFLNGQPQSIVFQSHCVVVTSISVLVLLCCPAFVICPIPFSLPIVISLLLAPWAVSVLGWLVCVARCQVMEWGVWMMQCVSRCQLPKKAAQHMALFAFDGVRQCVMMYGGWWVSVSVCCGVVVWWVQGEKREDANTQSNKNKKDFSQNHFSLSPFFFFILFFFHSFFLAFHSSTITPFLSEYTPVFHASHIGAFTVNQKHQWHNTWFFSSSFLFVQTLFFSSFPSRDYSVLMQSQSNTIKPSNNTYFT